MKRIGLILIVIILLTSSGVSQTIQHPHFDPTIFEGSTNVMEVYSAALEDNLLGDSPTQPTRIYLPPGYNLYPDNEYPVIYLLHGHYGDHNTFYQSDNNLFQLLNRMISLKIIVPLIVVTPNGTNEYAGSMYTNSYVSGNWEDYIVQDVIQSIESKYNVLRQSRSRGFSGSSMGAYGTIIIAMKHPYLFNSIGLLTAGLLDFDVFLENGYIYNELITIACGNPFPINEEWREMLINSFAVAFAPESTVKPVLGSIPLTCEGELIDSIWQKWLMHDPITMLQSYKDSLLKVDNIQMYAGERDPYRPYADSFHLALLDQGIPHGY